MRRADKLTSSKFENLNLLEPYSRLGTPLDLSQEQIFKRLVTVMSVNPLNAELKPICHLLVLLGSHPIFHVSGIRVKAVSIFMTCQRTAVTELNANPLHALYCTF